MYVSACFFAHSYSPTVRIPILLMLTSALEKKALCINMMLITNVNINIGGM
ncbi:hypothetical protein PROVALCAL_01578 [Providencia alcalifaciens DSM 30120]|uniref:Uncharacterized protein n=1 Tax=Providencia alcalifaciens DSM 30120 TaxID=520999 RepID=B6XE04_9GAMM|nr:hypothetical protein PROVALCAL_01578 [Providencia alcalifaciens DSM 30120]